MRDNPSPYTDAPLLSRLFFQYPQAILKSGMTTPIAPKDIPSPPTEILCDLNYEIFSELYKDEKIEHGDHWALIKSLWQMVSSRYIGSLLLFFLNLTSEFASPFILSWLILWFKEDDGEIGVAIGYTLMMAGLIIFQAVCWEHFCYLNNVLEISIISALKTAVFEKSLRISNLAKGNAQNVMNVDPDTVGRWIWFGYKLFCFPVYILGSVICLFVFLGMPALTSPIIIAILMPIIFCLMGGFTKTYNKIMSIKDRRITKLSELLQAMMIVKTFCWETVMKQAVQEIRKEEIKYLKKFSYTIAFYMFFLVSIYTIISVGTLTVYALLNGTITPDIIFPVLMIFQTFSWPITELPNVIMETTEAVVSLKRLDKFLRRSEISSRPDLDNRNHSIVVRNASFSHYQIDIDDESDDDETGTLLPLSPFDPIQLDNSSGDFILENINLNLENGDLVAIIGRIGSGKTSFLNALLGEMHLDSGTVNINGSCSFVPQQAWIYNATIRENILNGSPMDEEKYQSVLECCALEDDLKIITGGDMAEIGEKGINLSGGQKQRISLARAVYSDTDILLLDDPLSAVDSHVGHLLFHQCISKKCNGKIRVLVTHQLQYLPYVDHILVMDNGKIQQLGTYEELLDSAFDFAEMLRDIKEDDLKKSSDTLHVSNELIMSNELRFSTEILKNVSLDEPKEEKKIEKLIDEEERVTGSVSIQVYLKYFKALGGIKVLVLFLFLSILYEVLSTGKNIWVVFWSENTKESETYFFLGVFVSIGLLTCLVAFVKQFYWAKVTLDGSKSLHEKQLASVFRAPMSYFHSTPTGRIINRFSKDQMAVDLEIPDEISDTVLCIFNILSIFITSIVITRGLFAAVMIPLGILYYYILQYFNSTNREVGRLRSIAKSPIFSFYSEIIDGLPVVRGFKMEKRVSEKMKDLVNDVAKLDIFQIATYRWLGLRIKAVSVISMVSIAMIGIFARNLLVPSEIGLLLSYTGSLMGGLNWFVRVYSSLEGNMNHVERILDMINLESEADLIVDNHRTPRSWPQNGGINFENVSMRYRDGLPLVLDNVSFEIYPQEKIGVVGRTGAGKSSLINVIFRLVEPCNGVIHIDGINISEIGLHELRKKIAIIPQDAVLFSGTIRSNIDPFDEYQDPDLWQVLERVHLKSFVSQLKDQLESEVLENGKNLSVGQRQLICIGRSLLLGCKIIIMDEATASVDNETDELIQETIRREFEDRTVITIAHRLNTVMDSNRIMVMEKGQLEEIDTPKNLLSNPSGLFTKLVENTGSGNAQFLKQLVE